MIQETQNINNTEVKIALENVNFFDAVSVSLLLLCVILISFIAYNVYAHYKLLSKIEDEGIVIDDEYNSVNSVIKTYDSIIKFSLKKFVKSYLFLTHYIHLFFIKVFDFIQSVFDFIYSLLRDSFVKKSVKNKVYVKHFWSNLKEFKKEMDEVVGGDSK